MAPDYKTSLVKEREIRLYSQRKAYIDYKSACEDINAYSVTLASEDDTYGLKTINPDNIIAAAGTPVTNPYPGRYEYVFTITPGLVYKLSWKIIPTIGADPIYSKEEIGPLASIQDVKIRASADYKGTFKTSSTAFLYLKITHLDGDAVDASLINVSIRDPSEEEIVLAAPEKLATGYYVYEWTLDSNQDTGEYDIVWAYTIGDVEQYELQRVQVSDDVESDTQPIYDSRATVLREALEYRLACAQNIPVFDEQARPFPGYSQYQVTFPNWNQSAGVRIYRNDRNNMIIDDLDVNYFKGYITFDYPMTSYDKIYVDYNFRWFTDNELYQYLVDAVNGFNAMPPVTNYTVESVPDAYTMAVIAHAAADALRKMMLCLNFQQPREVFGGEDMLSSVFGNFDSIKKNFETEWKLYFDEKKRGPYPSTMAVSVPEYTLPGGRSRWFRNIFSVGT